MKTFIDISVPALTFILLTAVGLGLTAADFERLRSHRSIVALGLLGPLLALPAIAVALTRLFESSPSVTVGVLLVAICPIGAMANTFTYVARASTALSVALAGLSCLGATITIPLLGNVLDRLLGQPLGLVAPLRVLAVQLLLVFAVPVALGLAVRRWVPGVAERHQGSLQRISFVGVSIVLLVIILDDPRGFASQLLTTVPLAALFVICAFTAGWTAAAAVRADRHDRFALAATFGSRNVGIATAIAVTLLGSAEFARFAGVYFLTEIPVMLIIVGLFRRVHGTEVAEGTA
jgi:BASS family bile acid:Na+ symporter